MYGSVSYRLHYKYTIEYNARTHQPQKHALIQMHFDHLGHGLHICIDLGLLIFEYIAQLEHRSGIFSAVVPLVVNGLLQMIDSK